MEQSKLQPKQLQETHVYLRKESSTSQNLSDLNESIDKLIANHRRHNNIRRSYAELQEIEQNFREFFEGLQKSSLVDNDTVILDELCRKVNEDAVLMHIRDSNTNERQHHEESVINLPLKNVKQMSLPPSPLKRRHHHERVMSALLQPKSIFTDVPNIFSQDLDENDDAWTAPQNRDTEKIDEMELKIAAETSTDIETERRGSDSLSEIKHLFSQMKKEYDQHRVEHSHQILEEIEKIAQDDNSSEEVQIYIRNRFEELKLMIEDLKCSYQEIKKALFELDDEKGYELEKAKKNAVIKYKNLPGGGVAVKIEATIDLPLFNLIALYYEPEGYAKWTPFCKESKLLNRLTRASNIFYLKWDLPPPVSNREGYLIGSGFDRFDINGSILMLARTIHNDPKLVERYGLNCSGKSKLTKMEIPYVGVELTPLTQNKTKLRLVSTFDPKIAFIPLSLTSWVARKGASYLLDTIIKHAANLSGAQWEQSLKNSKDFYDWLKILIDKHLNTNTPISGF